LAVMHIKYYQVGCKILQRSFQISEKIVRDIKAFKIL